MTTVSGKCWACGSDSLSAIFTIDGLALSSLILVEDRNEAIDFPRGDLQLVVCRTCGFIFNHSFRPELVDYTMPYESSQVFSPRFRQFADELIDHLVEDYQLEGKRILEIGCGDASFLQALCRRAGASGFGIDPTYDQSRIEDDVDVTGVAEFFDAERTHLTADLICCRHTLEHIQPVAEFVSLVRESAQRQPESIVFFEIPDTERILAEGAFWDVYNEHCSYFTLTSLSNLFRSRGFEVLRLAKGFDDQYLLINCRVADVDPFIDRRAVETIITKAEQFGDNARREIEIWRNMLDEADSRGTVVLWGASSKAVAFLAAVDRDAAVRAAVDINPFKQDRFLPGSGVSVIAPEALPGLSPDLVVIMNPVYRAEICAHLDYLGLKPEIYALGDQLVAGGIT